MVKQREKFMKRDCLISKIIKEVGIIRTGTFIAIYLLINLIHHSLKMRINFGHYNIFINFYKFNRKFNYVR
jgi:hypothetical protein